MAKSLGSFRFHGKMRNSSKGSNRAIPIPLEPLKDGHRMDPRERLFLEASERGDQATVMRLLQGPGSVNVNCTNIMGRTAIQIAVDNENIELVELLLKQEGIRIGDALLYAINEGVYRIAEMLIDHPSITRDMLGSEWAAYKQSCEESPDYSPDISPVILAAHCNQFEILQLLLSRGAHIDRPHTRACTCKKCKEQNNQDSLRHSLRRYQTYRALSSPAWISLTSSDPVLTAFKLSWDLDHLAMQENEFKDFYVELSEQCKKFACDLLHQCRSSEEVIAVLNKDTDSDDEDDGQDEIDTEKLTLSRLKMALKYRQKQFVSHPHCQQLLTSIWYEGLPGWRNRNFPTKILIIIGIIVLLPFMAVYYLIFPKSRIGLLLRSPFMKFMCHSASFSVFLVFLILASTSFGDFSQEDITARQQKRGPPPTPLEWLIVLYVTGFVWAECKQLWDEGLKAYIVQTWNWLDFIMLSLYLSTFSLRLVAFIQSYYPETYGPNRLSRTSWPSDDPTLISEGVFAIANVFSFARIIYLFQANPHLGPLQISLGCMIYDVGKFMFIFFLVLTSFACGLNQLYWYYSTPNGATNITRTGQEPPSAFDPLDRSYITLFWSLFGLTQLSTVREGDRIQPFTRQVGEYLLMAYHAMAIILLMNMLIAMMSNSFQDIENHADREWKFYRSKLWMGYFDEGSTLPSPFNLIISPKSIYFLVQHLRGLFLKCVKGRQATPRRKSSDQSDGKIKGVGDGTVGYANNHISLSDEHVSNHSPMQSPSNDQHERSKYNGDISMTTVHQHGHDCPKYQDVMRRLVSRYIHHWKKQLRQDGVNEDDLLEIKQDISSLRYELREDRKREVARTTGHVEALRRDILRNLRANTGAPEASNMSVPNGYAIDSSFSSTGQPSYGGLLSPADLESLKHEIVASIRADLRDLAREMATGGQANAQAGGAQQGIVLPPMSSELYQTHLYTQL